ncbi:hypothetical protein [Chryseobacterium taklimakanense]|uniref:Outer membrane protein beta-barrel domain-containing protein n=1 Tax=Chryseobacterium taklimakanense TaxID=536441 RepID=A0A3G8WHM9_9FLAO|nr:hypothetical protein [Chryseobacterium taklimakanense]AZI20690.1 hypothetical protein EIH08_08175 [Chryseobacterium taklimakanense]
MKENIKFVPGLNLLLAKDSKAMQVPLIMKYYIGPSFNLGLGPQFSIDMNNFPTVIKDYYNMFNIAAAAGLGYEFNN